MNHREVQGTADLKRVVKEFNQEIKEKYMYYKRKRVQSTSTFFFDHHEESLPVFRASSYAWCTITPYLASLLQTSATTTSIIKFEESEERKCLGNAEFTNTCSTELPRYIRYIAELYLNWYSQLFTVYSSTLAERVKERVAALKTKLDENDAEILAKSSIIEYIKRKIEAAKSGPEQLTQHKSHKVNHRELVQKVLQLKREGTYSIKDICATCKISTTTYYVICRREDRHEWPYIRPRGRQYTEESLQTYEKAHIKHMADMPEKSYTVPEMCAELTEKFHRIISRKKVYSYLSKGLGYTFKRSRYTAPPAFEPVQTVIRYKVCKTLIDYWRQGKNIVCLDESGFDLGMHKEYSYAKRGQRPYRIGITRSQRLNLIMAITNEHIFAYQVRKGAHNEHSFIAFLLDIACKMYQLGKDYAAKTVLYLDNHRAHTSALATKLINLLGITTVFAPVAYYQMNSIEYVIGIIKQRLKKMNYTTM